MADERYFWRVASGWFPVRSAVLSVSVNPGVLILGYQPICYLEPL